jgi:hypothetical protein
MKKEELMKLEGMTEELATKIVEMSGEEMKGMIPKSRLDEVIMERDNAKKDHADVLKQLGTLQKETGDVQSLKDKIQELQDNAKEVEKTHAAEIMKMQRENVDNELCITNKAKNNKAVLAMLDAVDEKLDIEAYRAERVKQFEAVVKSDSYLFGSSTMKGAKIGESGNDDGGKGVDTSKMTYSELAAYLVEHPEVQI